MTWKPFESKSLMDRRKSTKKDYPPKRKLPAYNESFTEMEQYHYDNFRPWGEHPIARKVKDCRGRVLRPVTQETWPCTGVVRQLGDPPPQFQVGASGGIGALTYSLDSRWREVNEAGDQATISGNGVLQIGDEDTAICSGPWPPWIIYNVCDDCGCSSGTIWLEDCSGDCDPCSDADCDPEMHIRSTSPPARETVKNSTKTYFLDGQQGDVFWSVVGEGASIDQAGTLTTDGDACGTLVITAIDSCCGVFTKNVQVTDAGFWLEVEFADASGGTPCNVLLYDCVYNDARRYEGRWMAKDGRPDADIATGCSSRPDHGACPDEDVFLEFGKIYEWRCRP